MFEKKTLNCISLIIKHQINKVLINLLESLENTIVFGCKKMPAFFRVRLSYMPLKCRVSNVMYVGLNCLNPAISWPKKVSVALIIALIIGFDFKDN